MDLGFYQLEHKILAEPLKVIMKVEEFDRDDQNFNQELKIVYQGSRQSFCF